MKITPTGGGGRTKASGAGMRYSSGRLDSFIHPRGGPGDRTRAGHCGRDRSGPLGRLRELREQAVAINDRRGQIDEFAVVYA